jgi:hypothetical protein
VPFYLLLWALPASRPDTVRQLTLEITQVRRNTVRNRALLIGTGWTLAVLAGLFWFKSFASLPIDMLWSLGGVAFGWAVVLLSALAWAQDGASEFAKKTVECETRAVINGLAQVVGLEVQRARSELMLADELLEHAIGQLMMAFDSVRDVNGAVTAMQFRDVVGQKLGHVRGELDTLGQLMQRICASGQVDFAAAVRDLLCELELKRATNPAQQQLMHAGEVVLF